MNAFNNLVACMTFSMGCTADESIPDLFAVNPYNIRKMFYNELAEYPNGHTADIEFKLKPEHAAFGFETNLKMVAPQSMVPSLQGSIWINKGDLSTSMDFEADGVRFTVKFSRNDAYKSKVVFEFHYVNPTIAQPEGGFTTVLKINGREVVTGRNNSVSVTTNISIYVDKVKNLIKDAYDYHDAAMHNIPLHT